jgi:hypothetical protein
MVAAPMTNARRETSNPSMPRPFDRESGSTRHAETVAP